MAEWMVCPFCQLKHTRRPDGNCPRCKQSVDGDGAKPASAEAAYDPPPPIAVGGGPLPDVYDGRPVSDAPQRPAYAGAGSHADMSEVPLGARIAGGILIGNALLLVAERLVAPSDEGFLRSPISMIIDLVIGITLLLGQEKYLRWAKIRIALGGILLPIVFLMSGSGTVAVFQILFSLGLALLIFGEPGIARTIVGSGLTGLYLLLCTLGLVGLTFGSSLRYAGQLDSNPVSTLRGDHYQYHLTPASAKWFLRNAEATHKDNPLADRWIVRPDVDAHVFVIAEKLPAGMRLDMDRLTEAVAQNARKTATKFEEVGREPITSRIASRLLEVRATAKGQELHFYYGLYASEPYIYQVIAMAREKEFGRLRGELKQTVASFEPDAETADEASGN
jgi:hypothetical protein